MAPTNEALQAVAQLNKQLAAINRQLEHSVKVARRRGSSWQAIGTALGISRQAAWEQFRRLEADSA